MFDDRKPETRPAQLPGTCLVRPIESLAQPGNLALRDADARIGDPDDQLPFRSGRRRDGDRPLRRGELDGIVQDVQQDLHQAVPVGPDRRQIRSDLPDDVQPFFGDPFRDDGQGVVEHLFDGQRLRPEMCLAQLDSGEGQEIVDEAVEALGVFMDRPQERTGLLPIVESALLERFDETDDRREGGSDLVGDVGHEIGADPFELLESRHVVEDQHGFPLPAGLAAEGGDGHVHHDRPVIPQTDLLADGLFPLPEPFQGVVEFDCF